MLLRLDLAAGAQAHAREVRTHGLAELRLGEEQEVLVAAAPDDERRDEPRLRREQERGDGVADGERVDVVRDHPLEVVARVRSGDPDEGARAVGHIHAY